jgi:Tol biopolymer transport system component
LRKYVAVVALNPEKPWITWYPESLFSEESPMVAPDSSGVYYITADRLCYTPLKGETRVIGKIPENYINNRFLYWAGTHLSISADGKWFLVDGEIGDDCFIALMDVKTGEFKLLHEFNYRHDHAGFSPVNPKQFLFPRDWRRDPATGKYQYMENRLYVMDTDQTYYRPLYPEFWEGKHGNTAHEWWSKDGIVCFVNYADGVFECNPDTLEKRHVWKRPLCHAHSNGDRTLFCGDQTPYEWKKRPVEILFYNRNTGEEKHIVTAMPYPPVPRGDYHLDPHPHFSPDGRYIVYMTTVLGKVDVAVTPVEPLLKK